MQFKTLKNMTIEKEIPKSQEKKVVHKLNNMQWSWMIEWKRIERIKKRTYSQTERQETSWNGSSNDQSTPHQLTSMKKS